MKIEPYHQNFNTNYNYNPTSAAGITVGGAAIASVVADPANYLTNAVYYYGNPIDLKTGVCTNGNVFKVDNSANSVADYVEVAGQIPNVGVISLSLYAVAVGEACSLSFGSASGLGTTIIPAGQAMQRYALENITPDVAARNLRVTIPAGGILYFILNQLEYGGTAMSVIPVQGASVTNNGDFLSDTSIQSRSYFNQANGAIIGEFDLDNIDSQPLGSFITLSYAASRNTDNMGVRISPTPNSIKGLGTAGGTAGSVTLGATAGQSTNTQLAGSIDKARDQYYAGFSWQQGSVLNIISGAMDFRPNSIGTWTNPLTRLDVGSYNSASWICGHLKSLRFWNTYPSIEQIGGHLDFSRWKAIIAIGQSLISYEYGDAAASGFNYGERSYIAQIEQSYPAARGALLHGAWGGASFSSSATPNNSFYDLQNNVFLPLTPHIVSMINAFQYGGGQCLVMNANQGISDLNLTRAQIIAVRKAIYGQVMSACNLPNLKIIEEMLGKRADSAGNDAGYQNYREFTRAVNASFPNAACGPESIVEPLADGTGHLTDLGFKEFGALNARAALAWIGAPNVTAPTSPFRIISASRVGATITLQATMPAGVTAILPASGNAANSIWRFWDQAAVPASSSGFLSFTGSEISVSSWTSSVSGNVVTMTLTLASTPSTANGGGCLYLYFGTAYKGGVLDYTTTIRGNDLLRQPLQSASMALPYTA